MSLFGSLGTFRGLAIAGGSAVEKIEALEKERQDKIYDGFKAWVDKTVPRAGEYKTKATILRRKIKDQLEQVVDKYFVDTNLTDSQKVAASRALLKDHGNKIENIDKAYEQSSALSQIVYNQASDAYKKKNKFIPLTTGAFVNSRLANLGNLKTKETMDDAALFTTRTNLGDFNESPEGIIKALSIYDGSNIFRTGFDEAHLRNVATESLPSGMEEFRGPMPELARVERQPTISTLDAMKEVQAYELNEAKLGKYISDIKKNTGLDPYKWKVSDWRNNYKTVIADAVNKTDFNFGAISFAQDGSVLLPMGQGVEKEGYEKAKQAVLNSSFANFVKGAISAKQQDSAQFLATAIPLANNVSAVEVPIINPNRPRTKDNINYSMLLSGHVYKFGGVRGIYMRTNPKAEDPMKQGVFEPIPR
tara:strand:+ start:16942 stop:18198 length:1257 start_codon:yes stop_codon:yes gene_type:complete